jgi:hypothetical protein
MEEGLRVLIYALLRVLDEFEEIDINPRDEAFSIHDLLKIIDINYDYHDAAERILKDWKDAHESREYRN